MTTETLEKLECLKNWVRHGALKVRVATGGVDEVHWETGDSGMESIEGKI
ncbi:hypothetical protein FOC4_g10002866 [Fusarium odoratissimum]|uniref:HAT C-terminal dimerisation domain-containing protein n=2 Tax=Fusarium oxysporum species complex TaxID=171631 RepID=N1S858_FUSC4|nr:hypothetical protein FOC4_g10002866 [Fusarium odoratissimum]TXC06035.1 hypothetical protein FocTR4_00010802 [Fusarium oxysporum f. sp. cubense]